MDGCGGGGCKTCIAPVDDAVDRLIGVDDIPVALGTLVMGHSES